MSLIKDEESDVGAVRMCITKWYSHGMFRQSLKNIQQIHIPKELLLGKNWAEKN